MCILVVKSKGNKLMERKTLKAMFDNNPDGGGFAYANNGKVIIKKGYMNFNSFYNALLEVDREVGLYDKNVIIHTRITTSGGTSKELCHPFTVCDDFDTMRKTEIETELVLAHNGIFSKEYIPTKDMKKINDTMLFVKNYIYPKFKEDSEFLNNNIVTEAIEKEIGSCKIALLNKDGEVFKFGNFIQDDGIFYSNNSYLEDDWYTQYVSPTLSSYYYDDDYYNSQTYSEDYYENIDIFSESLSLTEFSYVLDNELTYFNENSLIIYTDIEHDTIEEIEIDKDNSCYFAKTKDGTLVCIDYFDMRLVPISVEILDEFIDITTI